MDIISINRHNCNKLKGYWNELSKDIPYFYLVNMDELADSLLEHRRDGERVFNYLES